MIKEIWKDIPNYEGYYQISDMGRVKSLDRKILWNNQYAFVKGKILKPFKISNGYVTITLSKNGENRCKYYLIHRLVLLAFKGKSNLHCNHKNGIKTDNYLGNLEYCTRSENERHAYAIGLKETCRAAARKTGLYNKKLKQYRELMKIKINQLTKSGRLITSFESQSKASKITGIRQGSISNCLRGFQSYAGGYVWERAS